MLKSFAAGCSLLLGSVLSAHGADDVLVLDGTTNYVTVPNNAGLNFNYNKTSKSMAIMMWVSTSATSGVIFDRFDQTLDPLNQAGYRGSITAEGKLQVEFYGWSTGAPVITSTASINSNSWHHVAVVQDGTVVKIYVDGVESASSNASGYDDGVSNALDLILGAGQDFNDKYAGALDDFRIYMYSSGADNSITQADVQAVMTDTAGVHVIAQTDLVARYTFDSVLTNSGTLGTDIDGVGTGTLTYAPRSSFTPVLGLEITQLDELFMWTAAKEDGVKSYTVEQQIDGVWTVISSVPAGENNYSVRVPDVQGQYRLKVVDYSGFVQTFNPSPTVPQLTLETKAGWNLISLPFSVKSVADLEAQMGSQVWVWNAGHYVPALDVEAQQGFWIFQDEPTEITVEGLTLAVGQVELNRGWNLAGPVENCPTPEAVSVYGFNGTYEDLEFTSDLMTVGRGYWIFAEEAQSIDLK